MTTKPKSVPELRFPGFEGAWITRPIKQILEKTSQSVDVQHAAEYSEIGIRCHGKGIFHKEPVSGVSLGDKRIFWVEPDCLVLNIVFAWEQAVAKTSEAERGMVASHRFPMYAPKANAVDVDFVRRFFLRKRGKLLLEIASPGGAGRNRTLGQSEFDKVPVTFPTLPEQRKIAEFLTAVDGRLAQLRQKKALLEDYKKGVMQQLFTQALRFKDDHGNEFPDWEEKTLGDVAEIISGFSFKSGDFSGDDSNKVIRMSDLKSGRVAPEDHATVSDNVVSGLDRFLLRDGDFLFGMSGSLSNYAWVRQLDLPAYLNQRVGCLRKRDDNVPSFLHYLFLSAQVQKQIEANAVGAAQLNISSVFLREMELSLPSPPEQTKIANLLTALDGKIESVSSQISHTQAFKKGLLQQMFV